MTIPSERTRAVIYARRFLRDLLDPKKTPKVPRAVRDQARRVLRHFPGEYDMAALVKGGNKRGTFNEAIFGHCEETEEKDE